MADITWIVGVLAKATLLLVAGVGAAVALRRGSAAWRHLVWGTALAGLLVLPLASLVLPWRLAVVPLPAGSIVQPRTSPAPPGVTAVPPVAGQDARAVGGAGPARDAATGTPGAAIPSAASFHVSWLELLSGVWLLGALVLLARLAIGARVLRRVVRRATPLDARDWRRRLLEGSDRLALDRLPALVVSDRLPMPFACGLLRPAIVLPSSAAGWSERRRQAVLFHELAHLARRDLLVNAVAQVACALYWFHPLVWVAARKLRVESERACDDLVLGVGTRPSEYADHLLQIVCRAARAQTPAVALPMAQRHEFEGRMLAILERAARRDPASRRHAAVMGTLALAVMLPLAALAPAPPQAPPAPKAQPVVVQPPAGPEVRETERRTATAPRAPQREATRDSTPVSAPAAAVDSDAVVAALVRALEDSVAEVREDAAYALGRLEAREATEELQRALARDAAPQVREMAAWALGQIAARGSVPGLGAAARHDSAESVRTMAVWALGHVDDAAAVPALVAVLRDASAEARGRAAWALGTIEPAQAPAELRAALHDPAAEVRLRAAWALGRIGDSTVAPALAEAMRDPATEVRRAVLWALGRVGGEAAQRALLDATRDPDPEVRTRAVRALAGSHGDPWPWPWPMPMIR
jgi:beta-lactamase regulating signal transducer with metallopeptidase domain/HEAT repeat protein